MLPFNATVLALCLSYCIAFGAATLTQSTSFNQLAVCPATDKLNQLVKLEGANDRRTCFVDCATNSNCNVMYRTGVTCYFGTSEQQAALFTLTVSPNADPCVSHTKDARSKLVVLFDFRQGFNNLASPGTYDATPHGAVTRDAQGANFPGISNNDYIEVDTRSGSLISTYLDSPNSFSFYAKVVREQKYQSSYHAFFKCPMESSPKVMPFGDRDGRAWVEHQFLSVSTYPDLAETRQSAQVLPSNSPLAISLGAVFRGTSLSNFYLNGSELPTEADQRWGPYEAPRCLRLGFHTDSTRLLKGRMVCYAIAKAALSTAEFQQLDKLCPW